MRTSVSPAKGPIRIPPRARRGRRANLPGRQRRVQPNHDVETVLLHDLHLDAAQQLAEQDPLVNALGLTERAADVLDLLPVLEGRALIITPELRARVERGEEVE